MTMNKMNAGGAGRLEKLATRIKMLTVFRNLISKPIIKSFLAYNDAGCVGDKSLCYAEMVSEIYSSGKSMAQLITDMVYEDENPYIKAKAKGEEVSEDIAVAAERELSILSELASVGSEDFADDLWVDYISPFAKHEVDLLEGYEHRLSEINKYGYGIFSASCMFRLNDELVIEPIISADKIGMDSFVGYADERSKVVKNTEAFVEGRPAANALLCGDAGTGKSSTVKAVANAFFSKGVRLIEIRKDQLRHLPLVMGKINENPLKFIIFIDDLSFNKNDDNFSMLKATLEGSASVRAKNAVIYATSNRRHIIKESFSDREGSDIHRNDTIQETLSLSERFGLTVLFGKPDKKLYLDIVHELADRHGIEKDRAEMDIEAEAFALRRGYRSARCAEQYIDSLL